MAKKKMRLDDLVSNPRNPNSMEDTDKGMLARSLVEFGDLSGIIFNRTSGYLIGGHQRIDVFRQLLKDGAEIIVAKEYAKPSRTGTVADGVLDYQGENFAVRIVAWPPAKENAALIAANRFGRIGIDDGQKLKDLLEELDTGGFDMDLTGYSEKAMEELMTQFHVEDTQDAEPQVDRAEELREKWQVRTGDLWRIGEHRLLCGDSTKREDVQRVMDDGEANAVLCDPPYGQNQEGVGHDSPEEHSDLMRGAVNVLPISDGVIVAFQSPRTFHAWTDPARAKGFAFERMLWLYKAAQCTFPWRGWILKSESIPVFSVGKPYWQEVHPFAHDCYYLSEVSGELKPDSGWHGSVKPLSVVTDLMARICAPTATVFDGFLGSGTTLIAAANLGRRCFGIEISPAYCAVILQRAQDAFPGIEIRRDD
jgi:DNA modification methylase